LFLKKLGLPPPLSPDIKGPNGAKKSIRTPQTKPLIFGEIFVFCLIWGHYRNKSGVPPRGLWAGGALPDQPFLGQASEGAPEPAISTINYSTLGKRVPNAASCKPCRRKIVFRVPKNKNGKNEKPPCGHIYTNPFSLCLLQLPLHGSPKKKKKK